MDMLLTAYSPENFNLRDTLICEGLITVLSLLSCPIEIMLTSPRLYRCVRFVGIVPRSGAK